MIRDARATEAEFHDHLYGDEDEHVERSALIRAVHQRIVRELVARMRLTRASSVLSLGCGSGSIEAMLAPHVGRLVGTDVSAVGVERARARASAAGIVNVEFVSHDLTAGPLPWPEARFDAVFLFGVLHHIPDASIPGVLREARRVLTPGGHAYSADPGARRLVAVFKPLVRRLYRRFHSPEERELDDRALRRAFQEAGFSKVEAGAADFFLIPLGFVLPGFPRSLTPAAAMVDAALRRAPVLRSRASSFEILAAR